MYDEPQIADAASETLMPPSNEGSRRAWAILIGLVAANAAFNAAFEPFNGSGWGRTALVGITCAQPCLFAVWAMIGPAPAAKRLPLTIAAFLATVIAGRSTSQAWWSMEYIMLAAGFLGITSMVMLLVTRFRKWQIRRPLHSEDVATQNQFSLKFLLTITTICAVLLGLGRSFALQQSLGPNRNWSDIARDMLIPVMMIFVAILPTIAGGLLILSRRPERSVLFALPIAWLVLTWLAVELLSTLESPDRMEILRDVLLIQVGAVLAGVLFALAVRFAGYRLLNRANPTD